MARKQARRTPERPRNGRHRKVVLTGGPAAGKTAIADVLRRHLEGEIAVVPESASILFAGGFPRPTDVAGRRLVQKAVFSVQRELEEIYSLTHAQCPHILDRGSLDGAAYWPGGLDRFLGAMGTTLESEYRRYDAVIFLQSAAHGDEGYSTSENPHRIETPAQARLLDQRLATIWSNHPHFTLIPWESKFYEKVAAVLIAMGRALHLDTGVRRPRWSLKRKP